MRSVGASRAGELRALLQTCQEESLWGKGVQSLLQIEAGTSPEAQWPRKEQVMAR